MMLKKIMVIAVSLALLFSNFHIVHADADPDQAVKDMIDSYNKRLEVIQQLDGQEAELQGQLSAINRQIFEYDRLVSELQPNIDNVTAKIKSIRSEIANTQKDIESRNQLMKNRLNYMYTSGNMFVSYLDVLLGSANFADFIDRVSMLTSILSQDKQIIESMTEDQSKLIAMNDEMNRQQTLLLAQQGTLTSAKADQEIKIKERLDLLDQLQKQRSDEADHVQQEAEDLAKIDANLAPDVEKQLKATLEKTIASDGIWEWPVPSSHTITSDFGPRGNEFHAGIDIGAPIGTSIAAVDNGIVLYAGKASGFGNWVVIKHSNGLMSVYGHMYGDGIYVTVGQEVKRGQIIAVVGNDGESTGPHLHFGVATGITGHRLNYIDPRPYLNNVHM